MDFVADYIEFELERARLYSKVERQGFMVSGDAEALMRNHEQRSQNFQTKLGPLLTERRLTFLDSFDRAVLAEIDFF